MKQLPELIKTKVVRARIHEEDYNKLTQEAYQNKMNISEFLRALIKKELDLKLKGLLILMMIFMAACQNYPHEDTLCRHMIREASIYQGSKSTEQMLEEAKAEILSKCGNDNYRTESTSDDTVYMKFRYRCLSVCNTKDEVENNPSPGNQ